jgi:hypothetical protein
MELLLASAIGTQLLLVIALLDYASESLLKGSASGPAPPIPGVPVAGACSSPSLAA